ncbi:MAG: response regulator SirA, partial [Spirochaetes bacterium]
MLEKIVKRDGRIVPFNKEKIAFAVLQAAIAVGGRDKEEAEKVADEVIKMLSRKKYGNSYPTVEEIQDMVEKVLIERGHAKTAKAYIVYRYEHALKRQGQKSLTYSSENIPYRKLWQALSWAVDKKCVTLSQIAEYVDRRMDSERGFPALIKESEAFYKSQLEEVEKRILDDIERIKIIIIAGPSSSGKTTTTIKITEGLKKSADVGFVPLNVDNYFLDLDDQPKDTTGDYDYETPQALDLELIRKHLNALINGEEVPVPKYNFKTGKREGVLEKLKLKSNDIILIDSLHGMFPGIMEGIDDTKKFKLYIETLSQVKDENLRFIKW